jgi:hypothetical protein
VFVVSLHPPDSTTAGSIGCGRSGGFPAGVRIPAARSLQQRLTPNRLLGRVNVSARMFTRGVIVAGALGSGALAETIGVRLVFVVGGAVEIVAALLLSVALRPRPA